MSKPPPTLTIMESNALLDELLRVTGTKRQKMLGVRNYLIGLLMLDAGLRVGEVVKLHVDELYFDPEPVHTLILSERVTKNHIERTVPASQRIRHAITSMQNHWWSNRDDYDTVHAFRCFRYSNPLTTRQVERIIRRAAIESIGRPIHPHVLRHTFASRLMRTVNIRIVQVLLGHKEVTTTQIYTHPNEDDKRKAIDSLDVDNL